MSLLKYDPETGVFTWLADRAHNALAGCIAGSRLSSGYCQIKVGGPLFYTHRLAFLYMTGRWPSAEIDHIDHNRGNNAWGNLREATRSQNLASRRPWTCL